MGRTARPNKARCQNVMTGPDKSSFQSRLRQHGNNIITDRRLFHGPIKIYGSGIITAWITRWISVSTQLAQLWLVGRLRLAFSDVVYLAGARFLCFIRQWERVLRKLIYGCRSCAYRILKYAIVSVAVCLKTNIVKELFQNPILVTVHFECCFHYRFC